MIIPYVILLLAAASSIRGNEELVLETQQIVLKEYPYAFNPSIVRWRNILLMSFRVIPDVNNPFNSWIGLVSLDDNFNPVGAPQRLDLHGNGLLTRAEDARLVCVGGRLMIMFSDNLDAVVTRGGFRMYVGEVVIEDGVFLVKDVECLSSFDQQNPQRREKNWVPFDYYGELLCAYSIDPHLILHPLRGTGHCDTFVSSESKLGWRWGSLRGGTPALLDGDQYLAFFHSSYGKDPKKYVMGAYTFSHEIPCMITGISREPIIEKSFYEGKHYEPYWKSVEVVFPGGFIHTSEYVWLAYGRQDHEVWIAKLDKRTLYASLVPS